MAVSNAMLKKIKSQVNIVELAGDYFQLKRQGKRYTIVGDGSENDYSSILIYPETNSFFRNSNRHGGDVIKFVMETQIEGITSFQEATEFLRGRIDPNFKVDIQKNKDIKRMADMTQEEKITKIKECHDSLQSNFIPDTNNKNVIAYMLNERKIDKDILYREIEKGRIKQCVTPNGNKAVAFIGYNYGLYSAITMRSMNRNSHFKCDVKGCNYDVGWVVFPERDNNKVIYPDSKIFCFEGYIDMLSYQCMKTGISCNLDKDIFISCGSANKYMCVVNFIKEKKLNQDVIICFDNDEAGELLAKELESKVKELNQGNAVSFDVSESKDWNEDLKKCKSISVEQGRTLKERKVDAKNKCLNQDKKNSICIKKEYER